MSDSWSTTFAPSKFTLSDGNRTATATDHNQVDTIIGLLSHNAGKRYFEQTAAAGADLAWGLAQSTQSLGAQLWSTGVALRQTGNWRIGAAETASGAGAVASDTLGFAIDFAALLIWFRRTSVPGTWWGNGGVGDPVAGTNGFSISALAAVSLFLAFTSNQNGIDESATMNSDTTEFAAAAPSGYNPWYYAPVDGIVESTAVAGTFGATGTYAPVVAESFGITDSFSAQILSHTASIVETLAISDTPAISDVASSDSLVEGIRISDEWDAEYSGGPITFYPIYENINPVFMDLYVNDKLIVGGILLLDRVFVIRNDYLGFIGDIAIVDTQSNEDPVGVPLRLPPPDLRNRAQRALPLALGGKMPPEGQPNKIPGLGTRWLLTYWPVRPTTSAPSSAYQIVPLTDAPAQRVSVTLGGQSVRIDIYTKSLNVPVWNPGDIVT